MRPAQEWSGPNTTPQPQELLCRVRAWSEGRCLLSCPDQVSYSARPFGFSAPVIIMPPQRPSTMQPFPHGWTNAQPAHTAAASDHDQAGDGPDCRPNVI